MSQLFAKTKLSSIGLEVNAHEFRAVQLMSTSKSVRLVASAIIPRMDQGDLLGENHEVDAEELEWAAGILGRRGFVGDHVSIVLSTKSCSSHVLELPPVGSGAPVDQIARMEISRAKRTGPTDFQFGQWEMPAKGRTQETLAVAYDRSIIDQTIKRYEESGLIPVGIDLMELAICRASDNSSTMESNTINATVHIGWGSSLAVITLGQSVVYVRRIESGAKQIWKIAKERYGLSDKAAQEVLNDACLNDCSAGFAKMKRTTWTGLASDLASELDVAVAYVSHAYRMAPFGTIRLSGYGSANPVLDEQFDRVLGIPIECVTPSVLVDNLGRSQSSWSDVCRLSLAYGLAARFDQ